MVWAAAAALLLALLPAAVAGAPPPPARHVIFFLVDDYGFADASFKTALYPTKHLSPPPTPMFDELALAGVRLESYYVNKLCSPTRTALLSGRYAYTLGMDDGVIVDGSPTDLQLNLLTIGDRLQQAGWNTSAYGKWDAGCTVWGSTPTCRGFDHFSGFYSAASDYYTHQVGQGYDYHFDVGVDLSAKGDYTTHHVTKAVQAWITKQLQHSKQAKTFAYVAHQAVHGPLEVPVSYIEGPCEQLVPSNHPSRRIYCGMVRAADESLRNISQTYKALGIWEQTITIVSADNGGNVNDGGNNFPLRGNKATAWEGGVRGMGFISGAGIAPHVAGTVSHEIMHVTDWLPTIVGGIGGISLTPLGRPAVNPSRELVPLDGVDNWPMFSTGAVSARTEVLLDLQAMATWLPAADTLVPGSGALRQGKWKLLHGHTAVWKKKNASADMCTMRDGSTCATAPSKCTLNWTASSSPAWCPNGWVPAPSNTRPTVPIPPPDISCPGIAQGVPCLFQNDSAYLTGGTWLFDVEADPFEEHDLAAANPAVVAKLLAALQKYNNTHCNGARCEPDNSQPAGRPRGTPTTLHGLDVWMPWDGDPNPAACDTNRSLGRGGGGGGGDIGSFDHVIFGAEGHCTATGWTSGPEYSGPARLVQLLIDKAPHGGLVAASVHRAKAGDHGFNLMFPCVLVDTGKHVLAVASHHNATGPVTWEEQVCVAAGAVVPCVDLS